MEKIICIALCISSIFAFGSCSESKPDIYSMLVGLCDIFDDEYGPSLLYSDIETDGFHTASPEEFGRLFTGRIEPPYCFSRIAGYAIRLPVDDSGFEIHIVLCVNRSDTEEIAELLQKRVDRIRDSEIREYAPESYEKYFLGAEIYVYKSAVFLLATPDKKKKKKEIKRLY